MFKLCFVWVYIIKGCFPLSFSLQASAGFVWRIFLRLWEIFSRLPEVVLHKGKQNGFLWVLLSCNFLRQWAVLSFLLAKGLERLTNFSRRRANVQKTVFDDRSILWYKFLGTTLKNRILPDKNPCRSEPIRGRNFYTDFFILYRKGDVLM